MMTATSPQNTAPIACTLTEVGQADRTQQWRALLTRAVARRPVDGGIQVSFPADPALIGEVAELAVLEQQCCGFFSFTVSVGSSAEVTLEVRAPVGALEAVTSLFHAP